MKWLFDFCERVLSTAATRTGLCPCTCHVGGIHSAVNCPPTCPRWGDHFDGCHACGCPGAACVLGECYTAARQITAGPSPIFGLGEVLRWKRQPGKAARIFEIHFGAYTVELLSPLPYAGRAAGYRFTAPFADVQQLLEPIPTGERAA